MEEKSNFQKIYKYVMLIAITAFITFLLTSIGLYQYFVKDTDSGKYIVLNNSSSKDDSKVVSSLKNIMSLIDNYYLGEQDEEKLSEGAIKGYVNALGDQYTEYISKNDMEDYKNQIMGNYVGIGIYMVANTEKNLIQVLAPIKESPAESAGILPGDLIKSVDGVEYTSEDMTVAANKIKGEAGTKVKLKILRGDNELDFELTRAEIAMNPIEIKTLGDDNKIGYMEISSFDDKTGAKFKEKYEELQDKGITSLIIDLRNNGGGIVSEALEIADYIIEKNNVSLITVNKNDKEEISKTKIDPIVNVPIVLLVNENTASASEILAGALRDNNKVTLVGTKTFGKGVIQQIVQLQDGSGLKVTIEEYFTPNRTKINGEGLTPDEVVELPDSVENVLLVKESDDTQLKKAIEILKNK
ncbi:MAG: S41 family peptidase [Clostridia bacterium]|nr:S41 family peptidase [Clostridia bacterium]